MSEVKQHSALDARDDMLAIADTWPDLLDRLGSGGDSRIRDYVRGSRVPGLVIDEHVSQVMGEITLYLHQLARVLLDETDWLPACDPDDVPTMLTDIARNRIGHFTASPDLLVRDNFHDETRRLRHRAQNAAYPSGRRWIPLHIACTEHDTTDLGGRAPCPGEYRVLLDPDSHGLMPDMVCDVDPTHRITPAEWQRASRRAALDPAAAAALIARIKGA